MNISSIPAEWLPQYTYEDYERWEGDWELIHGFPYAMSPSANRKHQLVGQRFVRLVGNALNKDRSCGCDVFYKLDWIINDHTVVRPDVMIVCGKFEEDFLRFPPTLILEIASKSTRLKDRNIKFKLYESSGVKYYILADVEKNNIEVFMLKDNQYKDVTIDTLQLTSTCNIQIDFNQLWQ